MKCMMTESDYKERAFDEEYKRMIDEIDYSSSEYKIGTMNDMVKRRRLSKKRSIERKNRKQNRKNRKRK